MNLLIIGAHGKIGKLLVENLAKVPDYEVFGMIRKEEQIPVIKELGGIPVLADLENDFSAAYDAIDMVIFSAGSGGHTGPDKTTAIDQEAAIRAIKLAEATQTRFVMISTVGSGQPEKGPASLAHYLTAKGNADKTLLASKLDYTIIRPTTLTDGLPTGKIASVESLGSSTITRSDVAAFVAMILPLPSTFGHIYTIQNGETALADYL